MKPPRYSGKLLIGLSAMMESFSLHQAGNDDAKSEVLFGKTDRTSFSKLFGIARFRRITALLIWPRRLEAGRSGSGSDRPNRNPVQLCLDSLTRPRK